MGDRDEILVNFQAITGMEDIAVCLDILEQKNWDLVAALAGVMPHQDFTSATANGPSSSSNGPVRSAGVVDLTLPDGNEASGTSTLEPETNRSEYQSMFSCTLGVYFGEKILRLEMPLDTTLAELKLQLENETAVPPSEQVLSGWPDAMQIPEELEWKNVLQNQMTLGQLNLGADIYHIRMDHQNPSHFLSLPHPHALSNVALNEHDYINSNKSGGVLASRTFTVANHQSSLGMPIQETTASDIRSMSVDPGSLDEQLSSQGSGEGEGGGGNRKRGEFSGGVLSSELVVVGGVAGPVAGSSVVASEGGMVVGGLGVGSLSPGRLVSSPPPLTGSLQSQKITEREEVIEIHDSPSVSSNSPLPEEFNVDDDDFFDDGEIKSCSLLKAMKAPLVPEDCTEPYEALQCFTHSFELRYGSMHPLFLLGSLADVVAEASGPSIAIKSRKPMFVYLHHDKSVLSNVFCSQLLCSESIVNYLSMNFITWAWDLTLHVHRLKLLKMVEECFGSSAKTDVDGIRADHLPVIIIAYKEKGIVSIKSIIQGETNLDSLMTSLIVAIDEHANVIERELQDERERLAREDMIAEQNRAYEESLQADREKERIKRQQLEEEEQQRQIKEAQRAAMSEGVPMEPPEDCGEKMCTLRIRFPKGHVEQRRFLATHQLKDVIKFVGSKNFMVSEYKILTSFPKKDLTEQNYDLTLEELKLCPQETVFVEERT